MIQLPICCALRFHEFEILKVIGRSHLLDYHREGFTVYSTSSSPPPRVLLGQSFLPHPMRLRLMISFEAGSVGWPRGGWGETAWSRGAADVAVRELGMDDARGEGGRARPGHDEQAVKSHLELPMTPRKRYFFSMLCCCAIA
jgi:hypothetical protein